MDHVNLKSGGNFFHPNTTHAQTTDFPNVILTQSGRPVARAAVPAAAAKRAVPKAVLSVFLASPPTQVPESVVALVPVQVPAFHAGRSRADERL
jgi:antitoxin (DNA-binding transcriptional repressor) of toxin-antitoxin stability system